MANDVQRAGCDSRGVVVSLLVTNPLIHCLILLIAAAALAWRRHGGMALAAATVGIAWLYVCSTPAFVETLRHGLEARYPEHSDSSFAGVEAIVVLGGGGEELDVTREQTRWRLANDIRLGYALHLYKAGIAPMLVVSGRDDAIIMREGLIRAGVPPVRIVVEDQSETTHENAEFIAPRLASLGIRHVALVTSAAHMRRAKATLEKEGIIVTAAPAVTHQRPLTRSDSWLPRLRFYGEADRYMHEYVGLIFYSLRGWA